MTGQRAALIYVTSRQPLQTQLPEKPTPVDGSMTVLVIHTQDWTQPLHAYMTKGELLQDKTKTRHIVYRSKAYTIITSPTTTHIR